MFICLVQNKSEEMVRYLTLSTISSVDPKSRKGLEQDVSFLKIPWLWILKN